MKVFAMFVSMLALSRGMPSVLAPMNLVSLNVTNGVDCATLGPVLLTFAYAPDPASPNALRKRGDIFTLDNTMVTGTHDSRAYSTSKESSSLEESSKSIATSLNISGSYMAFSGSASLKFHSLSSSQHESLRRDVKLQAFQCELRASGDFHTRPELHLSESFTWAIANRDAATLARDFGPFYARGVQLGGQFATTYIMEKTSQDTSTTFSAEIEASYGKGPVEIKGALTLDTKNRHNTQSGSIERKVTWLGGDTSVLLSTPTDTSQINAEWAATFTNDNLYPFSFELRPIWDLVKSVNHEKGVQLEEAYASTWSAEFNELNRQINSLPPLPFDPVITDHAQRQNAKTKAQQRKEACVDERSSAQSWINTWWAGTDRKRNENWRDAANSCISEMDTIKSALDNHKTSVANFKTWLNDVAVQRKSRSKSHWGIGGHDSVESNRVNLGTSNKDYEILALFD